MRAGALHGLPSAGGCWTALLLPSRGQAQRGREAGFLARAAPAGGRPAAGLQARRVAATHSGGGTGVGSCSGRRAGHCSDLADDVWGHMVELALQPVLERRQRLACSAHAAVSICSWRHPGERQAPGTQGRQAYASLHICTRRSGTGAGCSQAGPSWQGMAAQAQPRPLLRAGGLLPGAVARLASQQLPQAGWNAPFGRTVAGLRSSSKKGCVKACIAEYRSVGLYCSSLDTCADGPGQSAAARRGRWQRGGCRMRAGHCSLLATQCMACRLPLDRQPGLQAGEGAHQVHCVGGHAL